MIDGTYNAGLVTLSKQLPPPSTALQVGQKAPEFVLADANDNPVALSSLLSAPMPGLQTPPKGVLLVFYRGYW
jgi:peroxiredoxin